jgi:hypothetical protein
VSYFGKSAWFCLFAFYHYESSMHYDNNTQVDVIYTDVSKAFDKLNHMLRSKLSAFGFSPSLLYLIKT